MHLADRIDLPEPLVARPFRGTDDLPAMLPVLAAYRAHLGDPDRPSLEQMELAYRHLTDCDPDLDTRTMAVNTSWVITSGRTGAKMTRSRTPEMIGDPRRDITLWKVAWAGDQVVGQVKPFIDHEDNAERGIRRGYAEYISTHRDWRNRGIAGTLLAMSLRELRDRGMTEAALGVDTNNPGGALQLYTSLGFELQRYEAVYTRQV